MRKTRTDLIIEADSLEAGTVVNEKIISNKNVELRGVAVKEVWNAERSIKITTVQIRTEDGAKAMERPIGTYITMELPELLQEGEELKEKAEKELEKQLRALFQGKTAEHILVVGLGNREVTADAIGPLTVEQLFVTRHLFSKEKKASEQLKKYRQISALVPGVMAQTGMETMELLRGIVEETHPDMVLVIDALAARSPKRLNTTIQLTDTGISPGAGVGNNRKELNETTLGCRSICKVPLQPGSFVPLRLKFLPHGREG